MDLSERALSERLVGGCGFDLKEVVDGFVTVELYTYPHQPEVAAKQALSYLQNILAEDKK